VRQPIYTSGIGYWRHYDSQLEELKEVLEPILERYSSAPQECTL